MKNMLLKAPNSQMDESVKEIIRRWSDNPLPVEILEALDHVIYYGTGSDLVVTVLTCVYDDSLLRTKSNHIDIEKIAENTWRKRS